LTVHANIKKAVEKICPGIDPALINNGLNAGLVKLIDCPDGDGPVCQIGEYWFYFNTDGHAEKNDGTWMTPEEYKASISPEELVCRICEALSEMLEENMEAEALYYQAYLREELAKAKA
jgi:hypothetical protein